MVGDLAILPVGVVHSLIAVLPYPHSLLFLISHAQPIIGPSRQKVPQSILWIMSFILLCWNLHVFGQCSNLFSFIVDLNQVATFTCTILKHGKLFNNLVNTWKHKKQSLIRLLPRTMSKSSFPQTIFCNSYCQLQSKWADNTHL